MGAHQWIAGPFKRYLLLQLMDATFTHICLIIMSLHHPSSSSLLQLFPLRRLTFDLLHSIPVLNYFAVSVTEKNVQLTPFKYTNGKIHSRPFLSSNTAGHITHRYALGSSGFVIALRQVFIFSLNFLWPAAAGRAVHNEVAIRR